MAKSLSKKLEAKRRSGNFLGIKIVRGENSINHSQLANDTFFLGGASTIIARRFKRILDMFVDSSKGKNKIQI
jgi:hypothetical protein